MADLTTLREIIGNRANATILDSTLQEMVSKTGSDNDAWFVCLTGGSYLSRHLNRETKQPMQAQALESVLRSSGGIRFGNEVQLSFDAVTRSPKRCHIVDRRDSLSGELGANAAAK